MIHKPFDAAQLTAQSENNMSSTTYPQAYDSNKSSSTYWAKHVAMIVLSIVLIVVPAILCFQFVQANAINIPYMDEWVIIRDYVKDFLTGRLDYLAFLNVQDSEHKIFVPYSFILLVAALTRYNGVALINCIYWFVAAQCAILLALAWPIVRDRKMALLALCPIAWLTFSIRSWENLLWTPQLAHTISCFLVVLCVFLLNRSRRLSISYGVALLSAFAATYCIASGITVWMVGFVQILLQRFIFLGAEGYASRDSDCRNWWQRLVVWSIVATATIVGYVIHLNLDVHGKNYSGNLTFSHLQHDLPTVIQFVLACLGSGLSTEKYAAIAIACLLLFLLISALISLRQANVEQRQHAVAPIALTVFVLSSVTLILVGRYGGGLDAAQHSRYCLYTCLGVVAIYMLMLSLGPVRTHWQSLRLGMLIALICFGSIATWQYGIACGDELRTFRLLLANAVRYRNIQNDETLVHYSDMNANIVREVADYLASNRMSLFADPPPLDVTRLVKLPITPTYCFKTLNNLPVYSYPLQKHVLIDTKTQPTLDFSGWAFCCVEPCYAVYLNIDNKLDIPSAMGLPQRDVVQTYGRQSLLYSGFAGMCRSDLIPKGVHTVTVKVVWPDKKTYYQSMPLATLEVI